MDHIHSRCCVWCVVGIFEHYNLSVCCHLDLLLRSKLNYRMAAWNGHNLSTLIISGVIISPDTYHIHTLAHMCTHTLLLLQAGVLSSNVYLPTHTAVPSRCANGTDTYRACPSVSHPVLHKPVHMCGHGSIKSTAGSQW